MSPHGQLHGKDWEICIGSMSSFNHGSFVFCDINRKEEGHNCVVKL